MVKTATFDFNSEVFQRQVNEAFDLYLKEQGSLLSLFLQNGKSLPVARETKYEWLESQLTPKSWTVNWAIAAWTFGTTPWTAANITLDSTTGLAPNDIIRFIDGATGGPVWNIQLQIVSVVDWTTATAYIYGWTTDTAIPDNAVAKYISNPSEENRKDFIASNNWEPNFEYNYTQIFEEVIELSDTMKRSLTYGNTSNMATQLKQAMYKIEQKIAEQSIYGRRVQRTGSGVGKTGSFGWLLQFVDVAEGNVVDWWGNTITSSKINDLAEEIKKDWGSFDAIICNYNQARKISAFNTNGNNPMIARNDTTTGSYVMNFVSDIPVAGWLVSKIVVDEKMPNDSVGLIDTSRIAIVPMENRDLKMINWTLPWQDGETAILRWEYTMVVRDWKYSAGLIKNLAL